MVLGHHGFSRTDSSAMEWCRERRWLTHPGSSGDASFSGGASGFGQAGPIAAPESEHQQSASWCY